MPLPENMNESRQQDKDGFSTKKEGPSDGNDRLQWFVMRDLKRRNARLPAYKLFDNLKIRFFTPMVWKLVTRHGKRVKEEVPFIQDLLFVHGTRQTVDPVVEKYGTVQYRYVRGGYKVPMTVREADMQRFIHAVESTENPRYYKPEEITPDMVGRKVRIADGPLDGYEGHLQKIQGAHAKRLFVEIPNLLAAAVEVQPEYILFL
jgi:transcription antitermination factor NusG